jgi:poly(3-hydroxybutyrate) depolymerase
MFLSQAPASDLDQIETLGSPDQPRTYRAFVPEIAGQKGHAPAIVLYNGSGSRVDGLITAWRATARAEGIVLLGPTASKPGAWYIPEDSPDFTRDVVEAAKRKFPIDPRRVYLFGHSGGAHHSLQLGVLEPEYFAAVAVHAGALREEFVPALQLARRRIPMAIWIGLDDKIVPPVYARQTYEVLQREGFPAKLVEMRKHGHNFNERADETVQQAWKFLRDKHLNKDPIYQPYKFGGA